MENFDIQAYMLVRVGQGWDLDTGTDDEGGIGRE